MVTILPPKNNVTSFHVSYDAVRVCTVAVAALYRLSSFMCPVEKVYAVCHQSSSALSYLARSATHTIMKTNPKMQMRPSCLIAAWPAVLSKPTRGTDMMEVRFDVWIFGCWM